MPESSGQQALLSRALGAFYGLAIGDALGMPTESRSRQDIVSRYGDLLGAFEPGPPDHPLAAGLPAGTVTDDTEQTVLLARLIVEYDGEIGPAELASRLLAWEDSMRARGSLSLLGPSTQRALGAISAGASIENAGRFGTTNGAAMRIAAAVSAGIDGATLPDAMRFAAAAAASAAQRGHWAAGADVGSRITWATGLVTGIGLADAMDVVYRLVGTSLATQESVPAAFAVAAASPDDPWLACRMAASLGGDCDTIAAMAGAICGACHGVEAFPASARSTVARVNNLGLEALAGDLLAVRAGAGPGASPRADRAAGDDATG